MSNKLKQTDFKNLCILLCQWHDQYIKSLDPSKMKKEENSYKKILIYHTRYMIVKDLSYLSLNKINRHIEQRNGNKCLTPVPTDESKDY